MKQLNYIQIDYSKPPPLLKQLIKRDRLTKHEAHTINRALAWNGTTLRWIPDSNDGTN